MESITDRLRQQIPQEIGKTGVISSTPQANVEVMKSINAMNREMGENEEMDEKWSEKYKKSIDCNNPKGFSQRAHCQGRKKHSETEEAIVRKPMKKDVTTDLVGKKKMNKPTSKMTSMLPIMGEDKSARRQFQKDLQVDKDYIDLKNDYLELKKTNQDFGLPNVTNYDPFIKKRKYKHVGKEENKEATGAGSAGGYSAPLFGETNEEEYCDSCDRVKSKCVCGDTKKVEATEATGSGGGVGSYESPAAFAKSTSKKDWRGKSKTQIPGGKFVQVKKKCKKSPYCNQGDINALKLTNEEVVNKIINKLSRKYNISESLIKKILIEEIKKY